VSVLARQIKRPLKRAILGLQSPARDAAWKVTGEELRGVAVRWPTTLQWAPGQVWVEPLFHGIRSRLPVKVTEIPQRLSGTVVIEMQRGQRTFRIALNCSDYPDLTHIGTDAGVHEGLDLEFKMQYRVGGYGRETIVPGGYVSDSMLVDWYARGPRRLRQRQRFSWDVYGRFGLQFATEVRTTAISALQNQDRVKFFGGGKKVGYPEFLAEVGRSKICLDLPGNGPLCFRLINYFAVGACVVSPPHAAIMPVPLEDRKHIVFTRPDMSDLVDLCEQYSNDAPARESIMRASQDYYRRHLYWRSLSDYYLRVMLDRLPV
jgi:glycosyl transferase family 1